jgi:hypothetical protein
MGIDPDFEVGSNTASDHMPISLILPFCRSGQVFRHIDGDSATDPPPPECDQDTCDGSRQLLHLRISEDENEWSSIQEKAAKYLPIFLAAVFSIVNGLGNMLDSFIPLELRETTLSPLEKMTELLNQFLYRLAKRTVKRNRSNVRSWFTETCVRLKNSAKRALRLFRREGGENNLREFIQAKKMYKEEIKKEWQEYNKAIEDSIKRAFASKDSRTIFKEVKQRLGSKSKGDPSCISSGDWIKHFGPILSGETKTNQRWEDDGNRGTEDVVLDAPISIQEIRSAISQLKKKKAPGVWGVPNLLLKVCKEPIAKLLEVIFNYIWTKGEYPADWVRALIQPVYKSKGSVQSPASYRAVSLLPTLGKLMTRIMNNRFSRWMDTNDQHSEFQAGFRRKMGCNDHTFVLSTLVSKSLSKKNGELKACFIDLRRAFDSVSRQGLLFKMRQAGINNKFYQIVKSMFEKATFCVKNGDGSYSRDHPYTAGVFQGDVTSGNFFNFFARDIGKCFDKPNHHCPELGGKSIPFLQYADDIILLSRTRIGLQRHLNELKKYCDEWGLEVNEDKSMAMVFRESGRIRKEDSWWYGNKRLKTVSEYKYLGFVFQSSGSVHKQVKSAVANARRALMPLTRFRWRFREISPRSLGMLFDTLVKPVMLYGSEIYGPLITSKNIVSGIEVPHNQWCRSILGVPRGIMADGARSELGRNKMSTEVKLKCIKFFLKVASAKRDSLTYSAFLEQKRLTGLDKECWGLGVKSLLDLAGFGSKWDRYFYAGENTRRVMKQVKARMIDIQNQRSQRRLGTSKLLSEFSKYTDCRTLSPYLTRHAFSERRFISLFRLNSIWSLPIEKRKSFYRCKLCLVPFPKSMTWNHFILKCSKISRHELGCPGLNPRQLYLYTNTKCTKGVQFRESLFKMMTNIVG